jgi:hypothetical protein
MKCSFRLPARTISGLGRSERRKRTAQHPWGITTVEQVITYDLVRQNFPSCANIDRWPEWIAHRDEEGLMVPIFLSSIGAQCRPCGVEWLRSIRLYS